MNLINDLRAIGLTKSEAAVYLYVLENGVSTPPQIAKGTSILRTNCYHIVQNLEQKGLLRPQAGRGKRVVYLASDPQALFHSIEIKQEAITRILPDLRGLYASQKNKPTIRFYDGLEQLKEVYWMSLDSKEIFAIGSPKTLHQLFPDFFQLYTQEIKKRNIVFHDIVTHPSKEKGIFYMGDVLKGLYEELSLPKKYGDLLTDILFWENHIALFTLHEPYFATVITSPLLAQTMKTLFRFMQDQLRGKENMLPSG